MLHLTRPLLDSVRRQGTNQYAFVDKTRVRVTGGPAGAGCISFEHLERGKKRANGGSGGDGGDVIVQACRGESTLGMAKKHFAAIKGTQGKGKSLDGKRGKDFVLKVPLGTIIKEVGELVYDEEDWEAMPTRTITTLADLSTHNSTYVAARGGLGGLGNNRFVSQYAKSSHENSVHDKAGLAAQPRRDPEHFHLELELKSIADVGLVGFPNAGKSSLLGQLSKARPTVDSYPFTTLSPTVGQVHYSDNKVILLADIPGLIEGAAVGRGRGVEFLRHVERTSALLYVLDLHGGESAGARGGRDEDAPVRDLEVLVKELEGYGDGSLREREAVVCCNKLDLVGALGAEGEDEREERIHKVSLASVRLGLSVRSVRGVSAVAGIGLGDLAMDLRASVEESRERKRVLMAAEDVREKAAAAKEEAEGEKEWTGEGRKPFYFNNQKGY